MRGRGGGWVVAQFVLMGLIVGALWVPPRWPAGARPALGVVGAVLAIAGGVVAIRASRALGRSFTPFPRPVGAGLVESGPFAVVRHPVYAGGLLLFGGFALFASVPSILLTALLALVWAGKARVEERLLARAYPGYAAYASRVRWRIVPFVY